MSEGGLCSLPLYLDDPPPPPESAVAALQNLVDAVSPDSLVSLARSRARQGGAAWGSAAVVPTGGERRKRKASTDGRGMRDGGLGDGGRQRPDPGDLGGRQRRPWTMVHGGWDGYRMLLQWISGEKTATVVVRGGNVGYGTGCRCKQPDYPNRVGTFIVREKGTVESWQ